ncbi:MAG: hypothetical protein ACYTG2_07525 [Planctomycetota bacterium]
MSGTLALLPDADEDADADEQADDARHLGRITGRLVDGLGRPVTGEPVFLLAEDDVWKREIPRDEDPPPLARMLARTLAGADGQFDLPAEAGVVHELFAGGRDWARVRMDDVISGDDVDLVMRDGYMLEGVVRDELTGAPVAESWVLAISEGSTLLGRAEANGRFRLGPLPELVFLVGAYAEGTGIAMQTEVLPALGELQLDLPRGLPLEGQVVDEETREPIPEGDVRLVIDVVAQMIGEQEELPDEQPVEEQRTTLDGDGRFALPGGPERGFTVEVEAPGYVPVRYDRYEDRSRDAGDVLEIRMRRAEPYVGHVVVAEGELPAVGARVELHAPQGMFASTVTDDEGAFSVEIADWDGRGPLLVHARDEQGRTARRRAGKREDPLVLALVPPLELAIEVVQGDDPVGGAMVAVRSEEALTTTARTDAQGRALVLHELAGPDLGDATVEARFGTMQSVPVQVDPDEPPEEAVRIELDGGDWLEGWVTDTFGVPVSSAELTLRADPRAGSPQRLVGHADREGRFRLGPLTPDITWRLYVSAEHHRNKTLRKLSAGPDPHYVSLDPVVSWTGRVVDATTGQPADGFSGQLLQEHAASGNVTLKNTRERMRRTPGVPGEFSFGIPGPGRYAIRIVAKDNITAESLVAATNGITPPAPVELMLWPAALLDVTVQDGRGRPVQGYEVSVIPWKLAGDGAGPSSKARKAGSRRRTDSGGVAHFNLSEGGDYRIAGGPGAWLDDTRVQALPGLTASRLYRLPATGDLEVTVVDENAQAMSGAMVELRSARDEKAHSIYLRKVAKEGVVMFETVPPGAYTVRLRRRSYTSATHPISVRGNVIERVRFAMQPRPPPSPEQASVLIDRRSRD